VPKYGHEGRHELDAGIELFADHYRAELSLAAAVLVAVGSLLVDLALAWLDPKTRASAI
jgi:hypothetical protein